MCGFENWAYYHAPQRTQDTCHGRRSECPWPKTSPFLHLVTAGEQRREESLSNEGTVEVSLDGHSEGWVETWASVSSLTAWYLGQESKFLPDSTGKRRLKRLYCLASQRRTRGTQSPQHLWDTWILIHRAVPGESFCCRSESLWTLPTSLRNMSRKRSANFIHQAIWNRGAPPMPICLFETGSHLSQDHIPSDSLSSQGWPYDSSSSTSQVLQF